MADKPFWQKFAFEICEALGVDPTKSCVSEIRLDVFPGNHLMPTATITIDLSDASGSGHRRIVETIQAAEWRNTRDTGEKIEAKEGKIAIEDFAANITDEERRQLYEMLNKRFGCRIY